MHIIAHVKKIAEESNLDDREIERVVDVLLPIVREKFKGMQFPDIEIIKEDGNIKIKASYTFQ